VFGHLPLLYGALLWQVAQNLSHCCISQDDFDYFYCLFDLKDTSVGKLQHLELHIILDFAEYD
jgi:hypothetical protein